MSDLQQRIAEKIDGVIGDDCEHSGLEQDPDTPGGCKDCHETAKRIAERLMPVVREAWDEGYTVGNAHNGRRDANPYRSNDE